jgi:hypothetical protein
MMFFGHRRSVRAFAAISYRFLGRLTHFVE